MIKNSFQYTRHTGGNMNLRSPLVGLLTACSVAALGACQEDDDPSTDIQYLEPSPVEVDLPERPELPEMLTPVARGAMPSGVEFPEDVYDWRVIGVTERADNGQLRVIVGNDVAIEAARAGDTNPWPDGTMLAHLIWAPATDEKSPNTIVPGAYGNLTLMVKDSEEYAEDGGWAYGLWATADLMSPMDPNFDQACVDCHTERVADNDYVFTQPGAFPSADAIANAAPTSNGLSLPAGILDWRVIGAAKRNDNNQLRVIVGNEIAVDAARAGETNPWPEGSMLAHFAWAVGENPNMTDVAPGDFGAFTLMVRDGEEYAEDGGWAYGAWATTALTPPEMENFDQGCVDCHTANVADRDYVFTVPGVLPEF